MSQSNAENVMGNVLKVVGAIVVVWIAFSIIGAVFGFVAHAFLWIALDSAAECGPSARSFTSSPFDQTSRNKTALSEPIASASSVPETTRGFIVSIV